MIQLFKCHIYPKSIQNVIEALQSGWTGLGPKTAEFENKIKEYLNTPYAIATDSCTSALQLAVSLLSAPEGSYIITTPLTFISTNHSILHGRHWPLFADIEPETGNISVESVARLMSHRFNGPRVKALMVVHFGGLPVDLDGIYDIANNAKIDVIEDAAHAFGAKYQDSRIGCLHSRLVCFSFQAVKPMAIGDGGMLTTNDPEVDKVARQLRWCGIDKSTADRFTKTSYKWDYNVPRVGWKANMNDIHAAIGLGQLENFDGGQAYKQQLVDLYKEIFIGIPQIKILDSKPDRVSANHLFVIKCENEIIKTELMEFLYQNNIQSGCHYRPSIMYKPYQGFQTDNGCKEAINFFQQAITLPLHLELTKEDVMYVGEKVKEFFKGR